MPQDAVGRKSFTPFRWTMLARLLVALVGISCSDAISPAGTELKRVDRSGNYTLPPITVKAWPDQTTFTVQCSPGFYESGGGWCQTQACITYGLCTETNDPCIDGNIGECVPHSSVTDPNAPPAEPPSGVSQTDYERLNDAEKKLCWAFPLECIMTLVSANRAIEWARSSALADGAPSTALHNDKYDAMRHALWQAMVTRDFGSAYAKMWGDAHEAGANNPPEERCMDQFNNQVGRSIASQYPGSQNWQLEGYVYNAATSSPPQTQNAPFTCSG